MRSCASRTPHEAELLFGLITQRRAGGQRAASTGAPRRNKAQGAVGTPRAAASSLVRCLSSDRPRTIGEAPRYGKPCWLHSKGSSISELKKPLRFRRGKTKRSAEHTSERQSIMSNKNG